MTSTQSWVHRRVDSLRLDAKGGTRRHVSLDVTLPREAVVPAQSRKRVVVPMGWMPKGPMTRLDTSQNGAGLVVLGKIENSALAFEMLRAALGHLPNQRNATDRDFAAFKALVEADDLVDRVRAREEFFTVVGELVDEKTLPEDQRWRFALFQNYVNLLEDNFLLLVELDEELIEIRSTLKFSIDVQPDFKPQRPLWFHWPVPDFRHAASQHVEIELPRGLEVKEMRFVAFDTAGEKTQQITEHPVGSGTTVHGVLKPSGRDVKANLGVRAEPVRQGLYMFTRVAVLTTVLLVILSAGLRQLDGFLLKDVDLPSPASSIILIAPALLLSWMSREREHEALFMMLEPLRRILFLCAGIFVTMAGLAAIPVSVPVWHTAWWAIYAATVAAVAYSVAVYRSYRKPSRGRVH